MIDILIVEDDREIADFVIRGLSAEGYRVYHADCAEAMWNALSEKEYPLVVLDRMLPDAEGAALCAALREDRAGVLILMLTAKDSLDDKLVGLRAGADDYMTKPFAFEELLVRIETLLRRGNRLEQSARLHCGPLELDLMHKTVTRDGSNVDLTPTEFALLRFLAQNAGKVQSRMDILSGVWGKNFDPNTNIVEVYIAYLRRKVDGPFEERLIRNIRGFGYVLEG
ncbi:MAG: response regulator transcription factor [Paracoccus sp. (in: a-proteobacteria)]